jgi:ankyrin repeat protein
MKNKSIKMKAALEEKIRREIERRVFEESQTRKDKKARALDEQDEIDALSEVSELSASEVERITRQVRAELETAPVSLIRRLLPILLVIVPVLATAGGVIGTLVFKTVPASGIVSGPGSIDQYVALLKAVEEGNATMTEYLLDKGAPLSMRSPTRFDYGASALMTAAATEHVPLVKLLLSRGADVSVRSQAKGWTALDYADERNNRALVDILGRAVADAAPESGPVRQLWKQGIPFSRCAYFYKTKSNDIPAVRLFLAAGMDVNAEGRDATDDRRSALAEAARLGLTDMVRLILAEARPGNKPLLSRPLEYAVREGRVDISRILLQAGADPNAVLLYHSLPNLPVASLLVEYGINVNAGVGNDQLPTLVAVLDTWYTAIDNPTRKRWVRWLLDHGADPKLRGGGLKTALQLAQAWGDPEVIAWITKAEGNSVFMFKKRDVPE